MTHDAFLFFLLLLIGTLAFYLLPFMPAILEWVNKTDATPSRVNFEDRTIVDYRIRMFNEYIEKNYSSFVATYSKLDVNYEGRNENGNEYVINGKTGSVHFSNKELIDKKTNRDVICCYRAALPHDMQFTKKVYAINSIEIGERSVIDELMAGGDIILGKGSSVNTLLCSDDTITVQADCNLKKYIKAKNKIDLLGNTEFQYLYAPLIKFGATQAQFPDHAIDVISANLPRKVFQEKVDVPENSNLSSHLVVKGALVIHQHSKIQGNIKCYKEVLVESNTTIMGSIICQNDLVILDNCVIQGPVISTGTIQIGKNCVFGTRDSMTTIVAENIIIAEGCLLSGLILAKVNGQFNSTGV